MDFEFTDDQVELRAAVRAFLEGESPIGVAREVTEKADWGPAQALWAKMAELDWPALTIPQELGGLGLGYVELAIVLEELGRAVTPGPFLATATQFVPVVREAGSTEQQQRFLGAVASEGLSGTLAVAEDPDGVWPRAMRTRARRDGEVWVLEGTKRYVADGDEASEIAVVAAVEEGDGTALFVVPRQDVSVTPVRVLDATQRQATVELTGVRVPQDRVLGTPGLVERPARRALEEAVTAVAISTVGTCEAIFDRTLDYVKSREQFGVPIGSFQAVKHKMADLYLSLERARAVSYFAALTLAEDDERRTLATSMAKAAAGECQRAMVQDGLQLHGGIGFTWEYDLHLYLKRAKMGDMQLGGASVHRARVAELIGLG